MRKGGTEFTILLLILTVHHMVSDISILQGSWVKVLNVTAKSSILGLRPRPDRPVCRLTDSHNVPDELAQVLFLRQDTDALDWRVFWRGGLVREGGVEGVRVFADLSIFNKREGKET